MKVLLIHQAFVSPNEAGGTRHFEIGQRLVQRGHDFTVIASNLSYLSGKKFSGESSQVQGGVRIFRVATYSALHRSFAHRVLAFISFMFSSFIKGLFVKDVDLVWGTTPPIFQAVSASLLACVRRKPFVLEIRDLWPEFAIEMGVLKNPLLIWIARKVEHCLYGQASHIIVNSPAYKKYLIEKGVDDNRITVIPNGVETSMFRPDDTGEHLRSRLGLNEKYVVTYSGALGMANDIPTLLEVASRLKSKKQIHFLLVGDGKERIQLEKLAEELDLTNVTFLGAKPKAEMPEVLAASDVCVAILMNISMFKTTYPNKVFDYMAAGRPTVLAIDGVIREVVESAQGGIFVNPGRADELSQAIEQLEASRDDARRMGIQARAYVATHFERAQQTEGLCKLLAELERA